MVIELVKIKFNENNSNYVFKYLPLVWCCDEIKNDKSFVLTDDYKIKNCNMVMSNTLLQPRICKILTINNFYDLDDGPSSEKFSTPIKYCPYCGKPIEFNISKEIDMSQEYQAIIDKIDVLRSEYLSSNSIKEKKLLNEEIHKLLYKDVDWYFYLSEFKEN